jgi:predicted nucleotidyltransferase
VHGSVALGTMNAHSDVDLIVEMPEGKYLGYDFFGLRKELREALGRKVDVHTPPSADSTPAVAAFIRRHQALIYDATDAE